MNRKYTKVKKYENIVITSYQPGHDIPLAIRIVQLPQLTQQT